MFLKNNMFAKICCGRIKSSIFAPERSIYEQQTILYYGLWVCNKKP
jgi:hypothetical protein